MDATFKMSGTAFDISIGLTGVMTLWLGLMRIGEAGGAIAIIPGVEGQSTTNIIERISK